MNKAYSKITFENSNTPALNASNMNKISKALDDIDNRVVENIGNIAGYVAKVDEVLAKETSINNAVTTTTANKNSAEASATSASASADLAEQYKDEAFSGTPQGYAQLVSDVSDVKDALGNISGAVNWVGGSTYVVGDFILYQNVMYRCIANNSSSTAPTSRIGQYWEVISVESINNDLGDVKTSLDSVLPNLWTGYDQTKTIGEYNVHTNKKFKEICPLAKSGMTCRLEIDGNPTENYIYFYGSINDVWMSGTTLTLTDAHLNDEIFVYGISGQTVTVSWKVTIANISKEVSDLKAEIGNEWNSSTTYAVGTYVAYNGAIYKCLVQNSGQTPPNTNYWSATTLNGAITALNNDKADMKDDVTVTYGSSLSSTDSNIKCYKIGNLAFVTGIIVTTSDPGWWNYVIRHLPKAKYQTSVEFHILGDSTTFYKGMIRANETDVLCMKTIPVGTYYCNFFYQYTE